MSKSFATYAVLTAQTGVKYKARPDLLLLLFKEPVAVAGVFTRSLCASAPVEHCQHILPYGKARALIVHAGNANAFTGKRGKEALEQMVHCTAQALNCPKEEVYIAATGVIGEIPDAAPILTCLLPLIGQGTNAIAHGQKAGPQDWEQAAHAIMTTDSFVKMATVSAFIEGVEISITAIAKGAGMIAPDMATMLAFIVTDAPIRQETLQALLANGVRESFNAITVDSDTSTSDTVLLFATGAAQAKGSCVEHFDNEKNVGIFSQALQQVMQDLALKIVRDGEGARHIIEVEVCGAVSDESARKIGFAIANSPLVKTAIAGEDANWGRVVMAVGKAGEKVERDKLAIWFCQHLVAKDGMVAPSYREEMVAPLMKAETVTIKVDVGLGDGYSKVYGCDLTAEYVAVNGNYRS